MMSTSPLLLAISLRLFLIVGADRNCNKHLSGKTISSDAIGDIEKKGSFKIFTNNLEDDPYILYKFRDSIAIASSKKGHIVTVNRRLDIDSQFYAFLNTQKSKEYLSIVISLSFNEWCRYDICVSCNGKDRKPTVNGDKRPDVAYFKWSKGIDFVGPRYRTDYRTTGISAEYVSVGSPKIVLSCYDRYREIRLRTPIGHQIASIDGISCSEALKRTFTIMALKTDLSAREIFHLGEKGKLHDFSWMYNKEDFTTVVFTTLNSPSKNSYWRRIPNETPNTCPFLKVQEMVSAHEEYKVGLHENTLTLVTVYRLPSNLVLECYKASKQEDSTFYSVFSDAGKTHAVTIKMFDCSSKDNFFKILFVERIKFDENNWVTVVGSRRSENDEWCSYGITPKIKNYETTTPFDAWVYYDFKPKDGHWNEISADALYTSLEVTAKNIKTSYDFLPEAEPVARYLSLESKYTLEDYKFLECYLENERRHVGVIKSSKNKVIVSITGFPCKSNSDLDIKSYIHFVYNKRERENYVTIGSRETAEDHWFCYNMCLDCQTRTRKHKTYILGCEPDIENIVKWSQAAVPWKRVDDTSFDDEDVISNYYYQPQDYNIIIMHPSKTGFVLRNSFGTHFSPIVLKDLNDIKKVYMGFFEGKKETKGYDYIDCENRSCIEQLTRDDKKIWLFFYEFGQRASYRYSYFVKYEDKEGCQSIIDRKKLGKGKTFGHELCSDEDITTYTTNFNPGLTMRCCTKENTAVVENDFLTLKDFDCSSKVNIKNLLMFTSSAEKVNKELIYGVRKGDKVVCWHNMVRTKEKLYTNVLINYKPEVDPPHQWYEEDSNNCPFDTKKDILFKKVPELKNTQESSNKKITYLAMTKKFAVKLECYEDNDGKFYSSEILLRGEDLVLFSVEVKRLECSSKSDLQKLHVSSWKGLSEDYLSVGIQVGPRWCRYDACVTCKSQNFRLNIDEAKPKEETRWSEPGFTIISQPITFKHEKDYFDGKELKKKDFKKMFYSNASVRFLIRCYKIENSYISVIASPSGVKFGTITGINCLQNQFYEYKVVTTKGNKWILSEDRLKYGNRLKEPYCWYYGCDEEKDPNENVMIFFFFWPEESTGSLQDTNGEIQTTTKPGWRIVESPFEPLQPEDEDNPANDQTQNQVSALTQTQQQSLQKTRHLQNIDIEGKNIIKREEIILEDITSTGSWVLVAKYRQKYDPGFVLLCQQSADNKYYSSVFSGEVHVLTIANHDCSPKRDSGFLIIVSIDERDKTSGKEFVFVKSSANAMFSICRKCKSVEYLPAYQAWKRSSWYQEPIMEGCTLKKTHILRGDQVLPVGLLKGKLVARYISDDGLYNLNCYERNNNEHVLDIRRILGETSAIQITGLDCSTDVNSVFYFASSYGSYTVGVPLAESPQNGRNFKLKTPWCIYNAWSPTLAELTTIEPKIYNEALTNIKWIKVSLDFNLLVKQKDILLEEHEITVEESDLKAVYLSKYADYGRSNHYTLLCYKSGLSEHISVIKQLGSFKLAVKGLNCLSLSSLQSVFFLSLDNMKMTVGFIRLYSPKKQIWCQYDVNLSGTKTVTPAGPQQIDKVVWLDSPFEPLQPEDEDNPANDQTQNQVSALTTQTQRQSLQPTKSTQNRETKNKDDEVVTASGITTEDNTRSMVLVAKYKQEKYTVLTLLCLRSEQNEYYLSLFDNDNHILTVNYDCSGVSIYLSPSDSLTIAVDKNDETNGKEFVFIWVRNKWFSVCRVCKSVTHLSLYNNGKPLEWKKELIIEGCPLKADDIYVEENKLAVQKDKLVARYISEPNGYNIYCYKSEGKEHILVIRQSNRFIISIKGLDCSYSKDVNSMFLFEHPYPNVMRVYATLPESRQNGRLLKLEHPWCVYKVYVPNVIAPEYYDKLRESIKWIEERECRAIKSRDISRLEGISTGRVKATYYNGRSNPFQLSCYENALKKPHAILSINSYEIKIDLDCASVNKIDDMFLADEDKGSGDIIIGSRPSPTSSWCYYAIPREKDKDIKLEGERDPSVLLSRWYMGSQAECPSVSRANIITSSLKVETISKTLVSTYSVDVKKEKEEELQTFILQCYRKNDKDAKYILTIAERKESNAENRYREKLPFEDNIVFLAAFDDFDCAPESNRPLHEKVYMFTFKDGSENILSFRSRVDTVKWCQYDICVEKCQDSDQVFLKYAANPGGFESIKEGVLLDKNPSFKDQRLVEDDSSFEEKKFEVKRYFKKHSKTSVIQYIILECYKISDPKSSRGVTTFFGVIKTTQGLILAKVKALNCFDDSNIFKIVLSYVMIKKGDGSGASLDLDFTTPPELGQESWFYGSATADTEVILFMEKSKSPHYNLWSMIRDGDDTCPTIHYTNERDIGTLLPEHELVAEYEFTPDPNSGLTKKLTLKCYEKSIMRPNEKDQTERQFYLQVLKEDTSSLGIIQNVRRCDSLSTLRDFNVKEHNEHDVKLIIFTVRITCPATFYSLISCENCEVKNWKYYDWGNSYSKSDQWKMLPTAFCKEFQEKNIHLDDQVRDGVRKHNSLINYSKENESTFLMTCFKIADGKFTTRVQKVDGTHVVSITSIDCSSPETFNEYNLSEKTKRMYTYVQKNGGKTYFTFITQDEKFTQTENWCRYDVCVECQSKEIISMVDTKSAYYGGRMKWQNGIDVSSDPKTENRDLSEGKLFSKHVNIENNDYSMECYEVYWERYEGKSSFETIVKGPNGYLFSVKRFACDLVVKVVYLHTKYNDRSYSLVRLNQKQKITEEMKTAQEKTVFIFDEELMSNELEWKLVSNLRLSMLNFMDFTGAKIGRK
ncbi:uncharacterized protein LOC128999825 [Macrosteles quadrilineatus]|uniref:uncharacterized protein LOC128999825 n=1 Tax=Macrosteles quadrilineatus TaxID=74068 RepID=UPI0023E0CC05|nr:uncharacterized protein LOC128999825 [Macrosteles quadrilineatus]